MEALQVQFDSTVRNAEGYVVDFLYGGDGMDAQYLEPFNLPIVSMSNNEMRQHYYLQQFDAPDLDPRWQCAVEHEFNTLIRLRDECRRSKRNPFSGEIETSVLLPAHVPRILENAKNCWFGSRRLTPSTLLNMVNTTMQNIQRVRRQGILYIEAALRAYVCSAKVCTLHHGQSWTVEMMSVVLEKVEKLFFRSLADSGEMVGALSSESIGEPSTQLTLNSVVGATPVFLQVAGSSVITSMGGLIDELLQKYASSVTTVPENRTEYLDVSSLDIFVPAFEPNGDCKMRHVTAVTRHLPVGDLVMATTRSGRSVIATQQKSFVKWDGHQFSACSGSSLKPGDLMPVCFRLRLSPETIQTTLDLRQIPLPNVYPHHPAGMELRLPECLPLDADFGFIVGIYLAEGWCTNTFMGISNKCEVIRQRVTNWCDKYGLIETQSDKFKNAELHDLELHSILLARLFKQLFGTGSKNKTVAPFVFNAPDEFVSNLVDGYFSGDGTVNEEQASIVASSASKEVLESISLLLTRMGIFATLHGNQPNTAYAYVLTIYGPHVSTFAQRVRFTEPAKQLRLEKWFQPSDLHTAVCHSVGDCILDPLMSVDWVTSQEPVYDLTVEGPKTFCLLNGLGVDDTFHLSGVGNKNVR
jgi:hypothetical protein